MPHRQQLIPPGIASWRGKHFLAKTVVVLVLVVAAFGTLITIWVRHWPFTRNAVVSALQSESGSSVQFTSFHQTYFPHPGCLAEGVTFVRAGEPGSPPFITMSRLIIVGSYSGLLTHRIAQVRAEGMHITVVRHSGGSPKSSSAPGAISTTSGITIGELIADGTQLEVTSGQPGDSPLQFSIQKLALHAIGRGHPLSFNAVLKIPEPPGDVKVTGRFGPWKSGDGGQTPLSGSFMLQHADLGTFSGLAGTVSASGKFDGVLQHVVVTGTTDTPDFVLTGNGHRVHLTTGFQAVVDGLNGDVALEPVVAHFGRTTIVAKTEIEGQSEQHGKTVVMSAYSKHARVEDLLQLFTKDSPPPMTGDIVFRAKVIVPPENRPFLDKVRLQGDFGILGAQYTRFQTQKNLDVLSARARGEADKVEDKQEKEEKKGDYNYDPGRVLSNVKGHVVLRNSIATLKDVSFNIPGASAVVTGTYNLKSEKIDLQGPVRLDAPLSQTTTGVKSFLLKIVQPLAHKKHQKGSTVEVKVAGTYHNPSFTVLPIAPK